MAKRLYALAGPHAPRDVRLRTARGLRELSATERLITLFILSHDRDEQVRRQAVETLKGLGKEELAHALATPLEPVVLKGLARLYGACGRRDVLPLIARNGGADDEVRGMVAADAGDGTPDKAAQKAQGRGAEPLSASDKVRLALRGNREARARLIRDPNRAVALSVLRNPSITEDEVVKFAASRSVLEDVLKEIASNRQWLKNYRIRYNLVTNPRTPLHIALRLIGQLHEKDLKIIARSKNIPAALAMAARRMVEGKERG